MDHVDIQVDELWSKVGVSLWNGMGMDIII